VAVAVKSDARWIAEFRTRFEPWWAEARGFIARHEYAQAFRAYPWPTFSESPWTPLAKPLAECTVAVVTTGGLYRRGVDVPFDGEAPEGDPSFRVIPASTDARTLAIAHPHFPHEVAEADVNTIFPLERLGELQRDGVIGGVAATHYSTMGYVVRADDLAMVTAPTIATLMREEAVDAALVVPV
jgi:D-proline reductase (dithiol) PrdB